MNIQENIETYIASHPEPKRSEMESLHQIILRAMPDCTLWYLDGKNDEGKIVSNPNIGYGHRQIEYADGKTKDFYQVGLSANTSGISVYIMGIKDKKYLSDTYGATIGKAKVTGYCINFKTLTDINVDVLESAIRDGAALNGPDMP
ncbi:MAG: DUF1801 domain-containing protein [Ignavibacteria bacterium]|nr:DUF1801 domain-containing protein [Ignavibacteria bacterium]